MKSSFKQVIGGVAVALVVPMFLSGCLVEIKPGKNKVQCELTLDCASNEVCGDDGFCQKDTMKPMACDSISDCTSGQICNDQSLCQNVDLCLSDVECGPQARCHTEDVCLSAPGGESLAVCLGYCEKVEGPTECFDDSECANGQYCDFDHVEHSHAPSADFAGLPQMPAPGQCLPLPAQECWGHSDCLEGQYCSPNWENKAASPGSSDGADAAEMMAPAGTCEDLTNDGCVSDNDCNADSSCNIVNPWGPGGQGTCVSNIRPCWSHQECGEGSYCSPEVGLHSEGGGSEGEPVMEAPMGVCAELLPGECFSDSDCGNKAVCEHPNPDLGPGSCAPVIVHCDSNNDCDWNEECVIDDAISPNGADAIPAPMGICVEKELTPCHSDWDCAEGEYCEFGTSDWSAFGCEEHSESMMPAPETGMCVPEDAAF